MIMICVSGNLEVLCNGHKKVYYHIYNVQNGQDYWYNAEMEYKTWIAYYNVRTVGIYIIMNVCNVLQGQFVRSVSQCYIGNKW